MLFNSENLETETKQSSPDFEDIADYDGVHVQIYHSGENVEENNSTVVEERGDLYVGSQREASPVPTPSVESHRGLELNAGREQISVHYYVSGTSEVRKYYTKKVPLKESDVAEDVDEDTEEDVRGKCKGGTLEASDEDEDHEDEEETECLDVSRGLIFGPHTTKGIRAGCIDPITTAGAQKLTASGIGVASGIFVEKKKYTQLQKWEFENGLDVDGVTDVKRWAVEVGLAGDGDEDGHTSKRVKRNHVIEPPKYGSSSARIMITSAPDPANPEDEEETTKSQEDEDSTCARKGKKKM